MAILELPVRSDRPAYNFVVELERRNYLFRFRFNTRLGLWIMDIAKTDETDVVAGIPVQTDCNLIGRFESDDLPPGLIMPLDASGNHADATRDNFGGAQGSVRLLYEESDS